MTLENAYHLLLDQSDLDEAMTDLASSHQTMRRRELAEHFTNRFLSQPPEQIGGVKETIANYLQPFITPEIAQVFCAAGSSFDFADLDRGKIICVAMPQKLQGDVQEIELEKALRERFPRDQIESVKSGARGADILQMVMSDSGQLCGTILWESKRVRNWSDKWIDKLIEDKQAAKADVAVIVTDALPEHVQHMGGVRGILITTFPLAACLAETLRVNMALLAQTRLALSGQDDQKSRIFQYFTSPQFHERIATIVEQFQQMQADLAREKAAMNRTWAKREKQMKRLFRTQRNSPENCRRCTVLSLPRLPQFALPGNEPGLANVVPTRRGVLGLQR